MRTYWKAEIHEHSEIQDFDFPERTTQADAVKDAAIALGRYTDDERRLQHITAFAVEWTEEDGFAENTGTQVEIGSNF